jgi:hypothetical protein
VGQCEGLHQELGFHYQVVQIEDQSQAWRWKDFKPKTFPTVIVQPPFDNSWGDPHTIVMLQEGYEKPEKLAPKFRAAIDKYTAKVKAAAGGLEVATCAGSHARPAAAACSRFERRGWTPPATPAECARTGTLYADDDTACEPEPILTLDQVQAAAPDADAKFWIDELAKGYTDPQ